MTMYVPSSTPYARPPWDPFGAPLMVIVGRDQNEVVFKVLENDMVFYSGYFKTVTSSFSLFDRTTGQIRLPSDDPHIFGIVHNYICHRTLPRTTEISFDVLVALYVFGLKRTMPLIQNIATDLFAAKIKSEKVLADRFAISSLWEETPPGCTMRRMVVDLVREMWIPEGKRHWVWNELAGGKTEDADRLIWVIDELLKIGKEIRVSARMTKLGAACEWHVHAPGVVCEGSDEARLGPSGREDGEINVFMGLGKKRRWYEEDDSCGEV